MTLRKHFGNCLAFVCAPYHMAYKFSGKSEYATLWSLYIFTQLSKMLLRETFFPDNPLPSYKLTKLRCHGDADVDEYDVLFEFLKATVDFADLLGIYFSLNAVDSKRHLKILTVAVGWAGAELFVSVLVLLWVSARDSELNWRYVRACCMTNVALVQYSVVAALVWLATQPTGAAPIVFTLLAAIPYHVVLQEIVEAALALTPIQSVGFQAAHAIVIFLTTLAIYARHQQHAK